MDTNQRNVGFIRQRLQIGVGLPTEVGVPEVV